MLLVVVGLCLVVGRRLLLEVCSVVAGGCRSWVLLCSLGGVGLVSFGCVGVVWCCRWRCLYRRDRLFVVDLACCLFGDWLSVVDRRCVLVLLFLLYLDCHCYDVVLVLLLLLSCLSWSACCRGGACARDQCTVR